MGVKDELDAAVVSGSHRMKQLPVKVPAKVGRKHLLEKIGVSASFHRSLL